DLDPLALLEVLVVLEEVADALQPVLRDLLDVLDVGVAGEHLGDRHGQDLLVGAGLVAHLQHAHRTAAHHRARDQRQRQHHQHVGRVAIAAQGVRHVAVVARVAHGGGEDAVDEDRAAFLVHFVLDRLGVLRDLDDDVDFLGRVASGIDLVEAHLWLRCECGWWKPAILRPAVLQCTKRRGRAAPDGTPGRDLVAGRGLEAWPAGAAGRPHWALRHMVRTLRTARARPQLAEKCMGRARRPGEGGRRRPLESRGSPRRWTPRIMNERIAHAGLASRLMSAEQAAALIQPGMAVGMSGFTGAGYPKAVPKALASRIEAAHGRGEQFAIRILTGASTAPELDGVLARAGGIEFRLPYQSDPELRGRINGGQIEYMDVHLGHVAQHALFGFLGRIDLAIVEVTAILPAGRLVPSTSVGNNKSWLDLADKVIIEVNHRQPRGMEGMHD